MEKQADDISEVGCVYFLEPQHTGIKLPASESLRSQSQLDLMCYNFAVHYFEYSCKRIL